MSWEIKQLYSLILFIADDQQPLAIKTEMPGCMEHTRLSTSATETPHESSSRREDRNPVVTAFRHDYVSVTVQGDSEGHVKVARCRTLLANSSQMLAMLCQDVQAMAALVRQHHTILTGCNTYRHTSTSRTGCSYSLAAFMRLMTITRLLA